MNGVLGGRFHSVFLILILALTLLPIAGVAQETQQSQTTGNPAISVEDLGDLVQSLTKDQTTAEADAWLALLQAKAKQISDLKIAARTAEGEAKTEFVNQISALTEERAALVARLETVLDSLAEKGSQDDRKPYDQYISAVSPVLDADVTDVGAVSQLARDWITSPTGGLLWAMNIIKFLVVLIFFKIIAAICAALTRKALKRVKNVSELLRDFIVNTTNKMIVLIGLMIAVSMLGVNIGPLLAGIGVVGFVVGFALQDTLSNFASGFMILLYRPYDIGDVVTAGGVTGKVESMNLVSTTFKTPDNQNIVVPNGSIWGGTVQNVTANDTRRVDLVFGIGYDDDIDKAQKVLEDLVNSHELVLKDPAPVIKLHELADSSVNFVVRPWTKTADYWTVFWDLTRSVKERFDAEGISIPYPQQDVHMHQVSA